MGELLALKTPCSFFLFHTTLFAFGNEPSLAAYRAQHAAFDNLLAESLEQLILRLAIA